MAHLRTRSNRDLEVKHLREKPRKKGKNWRKVEYMKVEYTKKKKVKIY